MVAREKLERNGVRLLYWRVGGDVKDLTTQMVVRELGLGRGKGAGWSKG